MKEKTQEAVVYLQSSARSITLPERYLSYTAELFGKEMGRPVSREEAIEIAENVMNYLEVLAGMAADADTSTAKT